MHIPILFCYMNFAIVVVYHICTIPIIGMPLSNELRTLDYIDKQTIMSKHFNCVL